VYAAFADGREAIWIDRVGIDEAAARLADGTVAFWSPG